MVLKKSKEKKHTKNSKNIYPKISTAYYDFFLISVLLLIDRLTKIFAINLKQPIGYIILEFIYVKNTGAGFSIFNNMNIVLAILASIIGIILTYYYVSKNKNIKVPRFSFITIISGTIGNIIDRIFNGGVIDFINFRFFPVFNFSDILIFIGVSYWIILIIKEN
jgi:signal peptidase II